MPLMRTTKTLTLLFGKMCLMNLIYQHPTRLA